MEFSDPELQKNYEKCKYTVKVWEYQFQKKRKRVPSKLDIKEANRDVRNAYRKYFQLKGIILEQSFKGIEGFDDAEGENDTEETYIKAQTLENNETVCTDVSPSESMQPVCNENVIDDRVWGTHLNNKPNADEFIEEKKEKKSNLNLNISKKLFCGSKFSKRNPRKSLSQKNKNGTDKTSSRSTPSFSSFSSEEALTSLQNEYPGNVFTNISHTVGALSQPMNVLKTIFDGSNKNLKTVDAEWLKRVAQITGTSRENPDPILFSNSDNYNQSESTKLDYDSDDVIENSDEEDMCKADLPFHVAKKIKIDNVNISRTNETSENDFELNTNKVEDIKKDLIPLEGVTVNKNKQETQKVNKEKVCLKQELECEKECSREAGITRLSKTDNETSHITKISKSKSDKTEFENNSKRKTKTRPTPNKSKGKMKIGKKSLSPKRNIQTVSPISQRRSSRITKLKVSLQEFSSGEEDAFHTDTDERDPEFHLNPEKNNPIQFQFPSDDDTTPKKATPKQTKKSNLSSSSKKNETNVTDRHEEVDGYDLEFSIKPRIVASRYGSIRNILSENKILAKGEKNAASEKRQDSDDKADVKNKRRQAKEKLQRKISSGSLNDNFVRLNIKKKVFVRGKSGRSFSRIKKTQWRKAKALAGADMDMGGCDGGMLTCFTCGQVGHFAQNCKRSTGDALLVLDANTEEECAFPTLEEAAEMAREANLNTRKPKLASKEVRYRVDTKETDDDPFNDGLDSERLLLETMKLEEHVNKLDVRMYTDDVKVVEPYYKLNEDGTVIDTPVEIFETLEKFGHTTFRPGQEQAIMRILSGKSTLVTLSTGSGKSLCYQLPAYMYAQREPCISLIISPLVSLMDDQILGIAKFMKAACLHSNQTAAQRKKILEAISTGELSILLVSPETVVSGEKQKGFSSFLRKLPPIAFACIDEAHCVSQWSHNFRPSYLMICRVLRHSLGVKTVLGLTATATKATQASIIQHLDIRDGENGVISDIPMPDNLQLSVSKDLNRDYALMELLLSERFKDCNSIIVYCTRRQECERIAAFLRTSLKNEKPAENAHKKRKRTSLQAEPYHAGLSAGRRRTIQKAFMAGELKIVVATVAFGMGINKADIRAVLHYNMPSSFESYVQEVGRAGRDGLAAQCHVFLDSKGGDENELRRHIYSNSIDRHVIRKLLEKIFIPCSCTGHCPKHEVAFSIESTVRALDVPEENISTLLCYLELHENRYIELLSPAYTNCKVISYSGPLQIRRVAKECPPLAMALALHKNKDGSNTNVLEFPVVDVAAAMGWESGICKHKLKNLEWTTANNQSKRSSITVEFSDLGFRLFAPGNLASELLDEALENLYARVIDQEGKALLQLNAVHQTLLQVAETSFKACLSEESDNLIKKKVREYFCTPDPLKLVPEIEYPKFNEEQLIADIHAVIFMYRDNTFTGRAIARIFQGIQSPNYPAVIWGRCKFWRRHLDKAFHVIVKVAAREILKLR